ncbi:MAG: DUF1800 family protein [Halioglobus sp.]
MESAVRQVDRVVPGMEALMQAVMLQSGFCTRYPAAFLLLLTLFLVIPAQTTAAPPPGKGKPQSGGNKNSLSVVNKKDWSVTHVRRVLRIFAYGGQATESQIANWAAMQPDQAVRKILTFEFNNIKLSPPEDATAQHCHSLIALQKFWGGDSIDNPLRYDDRVHYSEFGGDDDLDDDNYQRAYTLATTARGCNPFLYKTAFYLSNYHGAIHRANAGNSLIRTYFDDYLKALNRGDSFTDILTVGATHAAVSHAYRHEYNRVSSSGSFYGNEDFAREYFQLFFGIPGTTLDKDYYETVTIKNNARILSGMGVDQDASVLGSTRGSDWYFAPIDFSDHTDAQGRTLNNLSNHDSKCLEVLHQSVCGDTAEEKLRQLGPLASAHPESMTNTPEKIIRFFADDHLDANEKPALHQAWADSNYNLLSFLRSYAASTMFHNESTSKSFTAFDRNLIIQNAAFNTNKELFSTSYWRNAHDRMRRQGMEIFSPIRNVFGHQTGMDAANNRFIFRDAYFANSVFPGMLADVRLQYTLSVGGEVQESVKRWDSVIPTDDLGQHLVEQVAGWLWQRVIGDGGKNFDSIARAQVQAILAQGQDFVVSVDPLESDPNRYYTSADIGGDNTDAYEQNQENAATVMDLAEDIDNRRIGLAINFISMTPYSFAMEGI